MVQSLEKYLYFADVRNMGKLAGYGGHRNVSPCQSSRPQNRFFGRKFSSLQLGDRCGGKGGEGARQDGGGGGCHPGECFHHPRHHRLQHHGGYCRTGVIQGEYFSKLSPMKSASQLQALPAKDIALKCRVSC